MKKTLLSVFALFASMNMASAQYDPANSPFSTFEVDYSGGSNLTCLSGAAIQSGVNPTGAAYNANAAYIASKAYNYSTDAALTFTVGSSTPAGSVAKDPLWLYIFNKEGVGNTATCKELQNQTPAAQINMTTNSKVCVVAKSSVAGSQFSVDLWAVEVGQPWNNGATTYSTGGTTGNATMTTPSLTTSYAAYELDFSTKGDWANFGAKDSIAAFGVQAVVFDGATISIQKIILGNTGTCAVGSTTSSSSANVVNDQVVLFPNPAKGNFTVDMTAMNNTEAAVVKVLNANGTVVSEVSTSSATYAVNTANMNKGIYLVQITSGNKVATQRVVVE